MQRLLRTFVSVCLAIAVTLLFASRTLADSAQSRVEQDLEALHVWLDGSSQGPRWRKFLKSEALQKQLERGSQADPLVVSEILDQYTSAAAGLDKRRFVAVRRALENWLAELTRAEIADLPNLARDAKDHFRPIDEKELARKRTALERSIKLLDDVLIGAGAGKRGRWHKYLQWETLQDALADEDSPDLRALRGVELKFFALHKGLELVPFDSVRQRLRNYTNALIVAHPKTPDYYVQQLDRLAAGIETYIDQPNNENALAIGRIAGWLESAGQARWLVSSVRGQFWRPNLHAHISERLVAAGFQDKIDDTRRINENIMGANISGTVHTVAGISVDFVPNDRQAAFDFLIDGYANSSNVGVVRRVAVFSRGKTTIDGRTRIFIDDKGFSALPAEAHCTTSSVIDGVSAPLRIIENIAWRKAHQQKSTGEAIGSRRSEQKLRDMINSQVEEILAKLNDGFVEKFRKPLLRKDHFPQQLRFSTTDHQLNVTAMQASTFQVAAASDPPALIPNLDVSVRAHESMLGNLSEGWIGGETFDSVQLAELLEELTGEVPQELQAGSDEDERWSITFALSQPIAVAFDDNAITVSIRGRQFTRGEQVLDDAMGISVTYSIEKGTNGMQLKRQGDVEVEYLNLQRLGVPQVTFKTFMRRKFTALFKDEIVGEGVELGGRWKKLGKLRLEQLHCDDGWAAFGWTAPALHVLAAKPKSGKTK